MGHIATETEQPLFMVEEKKAASVEAWQKDATNVLAQLYGRVEGLEDQLRKEIQNRKFAVADIRRQMAELRGANKSGLLTDPETLNRAKENHVPAGYVMVKSYLQKNLPAEFQTAYQNSVTDLVRMKFFPSAKRLFGENTKSPWIAREDEVLNFIAGRMG